MLRSFTFSCLFIILVMIFNSCTTYNATISKKRELRYGAVEVTPAWEYKKPGAKKLLAPVAFAGAGAAYGYKTELVIDEETYTGEENALIMAGAGLVTGLVANAILFPKRGKRFQTDQAGKWLADYNRRTGADYVMVSPPESNRSLVVVPGGLIVTLRTQLAGLYRKLNNASPDLTVADLDIWRQDLQRAYSVLSAEEIRMAKGKLNEHEPRIAGLELARSGKEMERLPDTYRSLSKVENIGPVLKKTYSAATADDRKAFDAVREQKKERILSEEMAESKKELAALRLDLSNFGALNSFSGRFGNRYYRHRSHAAVAAVYDLIEQKRADFLADYEGELKTRIAGTQTVEDLDRISDLYLYEVGRSDYRGRELKRLADNRKAAIKAAQRAREKAAAERIAAEKRRRQQSWRAMTPAQRASTLTAHDLETAHLNYGNTIKNIYTGNFAKVSQSKSGLYLTSLVNNYVDALSANCISKLAVEKVPYYESVCAEERVTTNGWGIETNRECIRYRQQFAGYTTRTLLAARQEVAKQGAGQSLAMLGRYLFSDNPLQQAGIDMKTALNGKNDAAGLVREHGCDSPVLRRFEENLKRFLSGENPIKINF